MKLTWSVVGNGGDFLNWDDLLSMIQVPRPRSEKMKPHCSDTGDCDDGVNNNSVRRYPGVNGARGRL